VHFPAYSDEDNSVKLYPVSLAKGSIKALKKLAIDKYYLKKTKAAFKGKSL